MEENIMLLWWGFYFFFVEVERYKRFSVWPKRNHQRKIYVSKWDIYEESQGTLKKRK